MKAFFMEKKNGEEKGGNYLVKENITMAEPVTQSNRHCEDRARTLDSEFTFLAIKSSSHLGAFGSIS